MRVVSPYVTGPFAFNVKCVVFGLSLCAAYWYLPPRVVTLLPLIFIAGYIAMGWYDELYNCDTRLKSGTSPLGLAMLDTPFKPETSTAGPGSGNLSVSEGAVFRKRNIFLLHLVIVAPLLFYLAAYGSESDPRVWPLLGGLAMLVTAYHGGRLATL